MYRLYLLLKDHAEPPTDEEKAIAAGRKSLDAATAAKYLKHLEKASTNIVDLFNQQHQQAAVGPFLAHICNLISDIFYYSNKLGIRKPSRGFLVNGSLHAINPSMKSRSPNFAGYFSTHTFNCHFMSLIVPPSKNVS